MTRCKIHARPVRKILFKRLKHIQGRRCNADDDDGSVEAEDVEEIKPKPVVVEKIEGKDTAPVLETIVVVEKEKQVEVPPLEINAEEPEEQTRCYTPDEASFIIQGLYRCLKAHRNVVKQIQEQYRKVYSLKFGRYVYRYVGRVDSSIGLRVKSKLTQPTMISHKPINLHSKDLDITFTIELAIMRIQLFARYCKAIKYARLLARKYVRRIRDPVSGKYFYYSHRLGMKSWQKPKILGRQRWDPMDFTVWTEDDVHLYFRRLGLSKLGLADLVYRFEINGQLLLALDFDDFVRFSIPESIGKRIISDMDSFAKITKHSAESLRRREIIRLHFHLIQSAITIQKYARGYLYACKVDEFLRLMKRYKSQKEEKLPIWWSERKLQFMVVSDGHKNRKMHIFEG